MTANQVVCPNLVVFLSTEPYAGELEAVRLHLQQQVVHRYLHHPVLEQERFVRGEDPKVTAHHLFPRVHR